MSNAFPHAQQEVERALDRNELLLAYQPIIDLFDGTLGGVEALLRWNHPTRGLLWPDDFLPAVEDNQLAVRLGSFVIDAAAAQAASWRPHRAGRSLPVAVNVSTAHFDSDELVVQLAHSLRAHDLENGSLALEISEQTLFTEISRNRGRIDSLKRLGAQVVVDDFGTGYATATETDGSLREVGSPGARAGTTDGLLLSLVALEEFAVDILAVDRRLLERLFTRAADAALVHAVVRLAHRLGFRVLAEGVETARESEQLRRCGCDLAQGYYFHRPQSPEYIELLLREARDLRRERVIGRASR